MFMGPIIIARVRGSDATGNSEYFKNFCGLLPNCQFYPMSKAEWMDVRNGVIEVEQQVCQGSISAQEALDNLQNTGSPRTPCSRSSARSHRRSRRTP